MLYITKLRGIYSDMCELFKAMQCLSPKYIQELFRSKMFCNDNILEQPGYNMVGIWVELF